jgi:hypothetical protein
VFWSQALDGLFKAPKNNAVHPMIIPGVFILITTGKMVETPPAFKPFFVTDS